MISGLIYFILIIYVILFFAKSNIRQNYMSILTSYFSNVEKVYATSSMTLYKGDKSGENFLIAFKGNSSAVSLLDLSTIYETATKYHIHNKVLITNSKVHTSPTLNKKLKEYEIQVWDNITLARLSNSSNNTKYRNTTSSVNSSQGSFSPIKTSDTSDDNCDIDEPFDPIQDGAFKTHSIFSIFKDKPDRL